MERVSRAEAKEIKSVCLPPKRIFIDGDQRFETMENFLERHGCTLTSRVEVETSHEYKVPVAYYDIKLPEGSQYLRKGTKKVDALIAIPGEESDFVLQVVRGNRVVPDKLLPNVLEVEKE